MVREASRPVREGKCRKSFVYSYIDALERSGKASRGAARPEGQARAGIVQARRPEVRGCAEAHPFKSPYWPRDEEAAATWRVAGLGLRRRTDMAESSAGRK